MKFCIGTKQYPDDYFKDIDWGELYRFAEKQALLGVVFEGVQRLDCSKTMDKALLMKWIAASQMIKRSNMLINDTAAKIYKQFKEDGFDCCVLKGQGNAMMYPKPYSRVAGDIDLWVAADRKKILKYLEKNFAIGSLGYLHTEFQLKNGVEVEIHFRPSFLYNPIYNKRIQSYFKRDTSEQCGNEISLIGGAGNIAVPTTEFNVVFQLTHIYRHFFEEGIGLRQLVDYFYVLSLYKAKNNANSVQKSLEYLGLKKFASALMWVMQEVFAISDDMMIVQPNENVGKKLLREILDGGNFGHYAERYGGFKGKGKLARFQRKIYRDISFVMDYPSEALSVPLYFVWQYAWRLSHGDKNLLGYIASPRKLMYGKH